MLDSEVIARMLANTQEETWTGYCQFCPSIFAMAEGRAMLCYYLFWIWWLGSGGVWAGSVIGQVWSLGQVFIRTLGGKDITSGLVMGRMVTVPGFC